MVSSPIRTDANKYSFLNVHVAVCDLEETLDRDKFVVQTLLSLLSYKYNILQTANIFGSKWLANT